MSIHRNILAERYASPEMKELWGRENVIILSRRFWIAILKVRRESEKDPEIKTKLAEAIDDYSAVINEVDLDSIDAREFRLRHDQMAEIEEFNELAGSRMIHEKMTSRDKSENVEQLLHLDSLQLVRDRSVAVLAGLDELAGVYASIDMCGRTHNQPAQVTTLGKRFANIAEEFLLNFTHLENHLNQYNLRGIKGPVGTQQDMVLDDRRLFTIMRGINNRDIMDCVGQIYPRSLDFHTISALVGLAAAMSNFANLIRLMAGQEFVHEGFGEEQIGSTAMPHKMNARTCERIRGLYGVLKGHLAMVEHIAGDQWYEGDVSCSVVRRVVFPDAFFAIDGMIEAMLTVMDEMEIFPAVIEDDLNQYLPFLSTSTLLSAAIAKGVDRHTAHGIIRNHALRAVLMMRNGEEDENPDTGKPFFLEWLADDPGFPLGVGEIEQIVWNPTHGEAEEQIARLSNRIRQILKRFPQAALYEPHPIR